MARRQVSSVALACLEEDWVIVLKTHDGIGSMPVVASVRVTESIATKILGGSRGLRLRRFEKGCVSLSSDRKGNCYTCERSGPLGCSPYEAIVVY